jgi:hypothetical protein
MDGGRRDDENSGGLRVANIESRGIAIMDSPDTCQPPVGAALRLNVL